MAIFLFSALDVHDTKSQCIDAITVVSQSNNIVVIPATTIFFHSMTIISIISFSNSGVLPMQLVLIALITPMLLHFSAKKHSLLHL